MTDPASVMRTWLVPRRPDYAIFLYLVVPTNIALTLAMGLTSGVILGQVMSHFLTSLFLLVVGGALGLGVSIISTLLTPRDTFKQPLPLAVLAAYGPHVAGAYLGVSLALWIRMRPPFGFPAIDGPITAILLVGFSLAWFLLGLLANHLAQASDRRVAYERELAHQVKELASSRRRFVMVQERLKREIASHLHGKVQGSLWVIIYRLRECSESAAGSLTNGLRPKLEEAIEELVRVTGDDLRDISHQLHPSLIRLSLPSALRALGDRFSPVIPIELSIDPMVEELESTDEKLSEELRLALYRVAEEALNNVIKHAEATSVRMSLAATWSGRRVVLKVEDDGKGFDPDECGHGFGIATMKDGVTAIGGTCEIDSSPDAGTRLTVTAQRFPSGVSPLDVWDHPHHERQALAVGNPH